MADLSIFNGDGFSSYELSDAIEIIPNNYGRIGQLGIFADDPVSTTTVGIERLNGTLNVLEITERGGPALVNGADKRDVRFIEIPNFTVIDKVYASDVQNIRAFGSTSEMEQVAQLVMRRMAKMKTKHEITLEYMRAGALQGIIKDGAGTVLLDLFAAFNITRKSLDFKFGTEGATVDQKFREIKRYIKKNLKGEVMSGVYCLCGPGWFDKFIASESVKEAYKYYAATTNNSPLREDVSNEFTYQGVVIEEYDGFTTTKAGIELPFIPENEAVFLPMGTMDTFTTKLAPADFMETVNTLGQFLYAKQAPADNFNRAVELLTQSNPLPVCLRPELLVRGFSSN